MKKSKGLPGFQNLARLVCINCRQEYETWLESHNCGYCGDILDVIYRYPSRPNTRRLKQVWLKRRMSTKQIDRSGVWRFREMLPFIADGSKVVTLEEGDTPLYKARTTAEYTGVANLYLKHQGLNPTGSFKDPGMTAAISQANALGMKAVICASTGNTSASMAAYAARAGILPIVLLPAGQISYSKLSQALDYGALTIQINGDFDLAMQLVKEVSPRLKIYVANSINPFRIEGQKTIVFELLEQLEWRVPDRIVVPGGNLGNASSIWKALGELYAQGFIKRLPKITIVQAAGAAPLYRTVTSGDNKTLITVHAKTLATAVKIGNPVSWKKAIQGVEKSDGWICEVSEQEIADAKAMVGREGIGCEPASALSVAGLKKIIDEGTDGPVNRKEMVVAILTGNMLKDPDYTGSYHREELYEEYTITSRHNPQGTKIRSTYANKLITIPAKKQALEKVIKEYMNR